MRRRPYIWFRISPGSLKSMLSNVLDVSRRNEEEYSEPTALVLWRYTNEDDLANQILSAIDNVI